MHWTLAVLVCVIVLDDVDAGSPFPPEAQYLTMQTFRKINPTIEEDWTDYMQELAGEFTDCNAIFEHRGHWEVIGDDGVPKKAPNGDRIGGLMDYVDTDTTERQGIDNIAKQMFDKWIGTFPFNEQIRVAKHFGCSVQPGCPGTFREGVNAPNGYAVVGCGYFPTCKNEGCLADAPPPTQPPIVVKARAFTPQQYDVAENYLYGKIWDRTHLLEDLSGIETDCSMVGSATWPYTQVLNQARLRNLDVYGYFGSSLNRGTTPEPMVEVLRDISNRERDSRDIGPKGNYFGCSIIPDCMIRNQMYVVVNCLFSRTPIQPRRNNPQRDVVRSRGANTLNSRVINSETPPQPQYLPANPNQGPNYRPEPRPINPNNQPQTRPIDPNNRPQTRPIDPNNRPQTRPIDPNNRPQTRPINPNNLPQTRPINNFANIPPQGSPVRQSYEPVPPVAREDLRPVPPIAREDLRPVPPIAREDLRPVPPIAREDLRPVPPIAREEDVNARVRRGDQGK